MFILPRLPYDTAALEPTLSADTLHTHHDKHHKTYVEKTNETFAKMANAPTPLAEEILAGRQRLADVDREKVHAVTLEDHVAMAGQGRITDRSAENLGGSDGSIIIMRRLWERELTALAEGRPLARWTRAPGLQPSEWRDVAPAKAG